jgi:hypothetical protein
MSRETSSQHRDWLPFEAKRAPRAVRALQGGAVATLCLGLQLGKAHAAECTAPAPWERLPEVAGELSEPLPVALGVAAVLPPIALAPTGADHEIRVFSQRELGGQYDLEPVSVVAPFALAGAALAGYGLSTAFAACESQRVHAALLQSVALSAGTVLLLKWVTGREFPSGRADPRAADRLEHPEYARRFEPFAFRLTAWPSGHSAVFFAGAASLRSVLPDAGVWRFAGYPFALAVGAGMWLGDHHWASDILSGALIGEAIGGSVGRAFLPEPEPSAGHASVSVVFVEQGALLGWQGVW